MKKLLTILVVFSLKGMELQLPQPIQGPLISRTPTWLPEQTMQIPSIQEAKLEECIRTTKIQSSRKQKTLRSVLKCPRCGKLYSRPLLLYHIKRHIKAIKLA